MYSCSKRVPAPVCMCADDSRRAAPPPRGVTTQHTFAGYGGRARPCATFCPPLACSSLGSDLRLMSRAVRAGSASRMYRACVRDGNEWTYDGAMSHCATARPRFVLCACRSPHRLNLSTLDILVCALVVRPPDGCILRLRSRTTSGWRDICIYALFVSF